MTVGAPTRDPASAVPLAPTSASDTCPVVAPVYAYEYCVVRYSHDPAAGESLNLGVVLYSRDAAFLQARLQTRYARLSAAFPAFDGEQHVKVLDRLERGIESGRGQVAQATDPDALPLLDVPESLSSIVNPLWEDQGLSYRLGPSLCGASDDLEDALNALFDRFVLSQSEPPKRIKREDRDVWNGTYHEALRRRHVTDYLEEHTFQIGDFDYTFKNGTWHALKPVTLDYAEKSGIRERVDRVLGEAKALSTRRDLGMLYLLLGKPTDQEHMAAYQNARKLLDSVDIAHRIVEEDQAEQFGEELAESMRTYGIIKP